MKRKYMWMGIAGLILALDVSAVHARGNRGRNHHFAGPRFEALDLTQDQKDQIRSLRTDTEKKMIQLRADAEVARLELRELLHEKNPIQKSANQAVDKVAAAQSKVMKNRIQQKLFLNKILTDEQLQKLEKMTKGQRRGGRDGRRGHRGGRGMGWGGDGPNMSKKRGSRM